MSPGSQNKYLSIKFVKEGMRIKTHGSESRVKTHGSESRGQEEAACMRVFWPTRPLQ